MNVCTLVGRIGTHPDLRYTQQGTPVVRFRLAVRRNMPRGDAAEPGQQRQDTDWLTIVAFGRQAEIVNQYLDKGSLVAVVGRIQARQWVTQDGQNRETVEIVARRVEFLESKAEAERRRAEMARTADAGPEPEPDLPPPDEMDTLPDEGVFGDM